MQLQHANSHTLTDLDRQRLIFMRIYQRALDLGTAAIDAAEQEDLNGEADQLAGNRSASSEEQTSYGNPSPAVYQNK